MPKTINILSIDFDFFQNVDKHTLLMDYPDGVDLPTELSAVVWSGHYTNTACRKRLMQVTPATDKIKEIKQIIHEKKTKQTVSMICNSHVYAYDFIFQILLKHPECTKLNLYNLDMHHDIFNEHQGLDCGNWIRHVKQDVSTRNIQVSIHWICNPISMSVYGLDDTTDIQKICNIQTELTDLWNYRWHGIFLCRSDTWLPPHLDKDFITLAESLTAETKSSYVDKQVMTSRYTEEFQRDIKNMEQFLNAQHMYPLEKIS